MVHAINDPIAVAERLIGAIVAGNPEALRDVYAPEARIWHNNDGAEQSVDENLATLSWVVSNIRDLRYEEVIRERTETGFLQRHVLRGVAPSGAALEVRACLVCKVVNGRIVHLAEYLDTAHLMPLLVRA